MEGELRDPLTIWNEWAKEGRQKNLLFIKYLSNGREYCNSEKTGNSGVENWIGLYFFRILDPIAE